MWTLEGLTMSRDKTYPAGHPPHDPINGLRIGGLAGGVVGVLVVAAFDVAAFWLVLVFAAIGGGVGYLSEKHKQN